LITNYTIIDELSLAGVIHYEDAKVWLWTTMNNSG